MCKIIGISVVLMVSLIFAPLLFAQDTEDKLADLGFEVSGDLSIYSQYVWRGILLDRDASMQPGFYISSPKTKFGKFKIGVWSSQDLQNKDNLKSEEVDYIIDYTFDFKDFSLSFGHTYYDFPETDTFSREFYIGVSLPKILLSPSVYFYRDYGRPEDGGAEGSYTSIGGSYSIPIKNTLLSLDLAGRIGFNHELFINGDGGDVGLKAGVTIPLTKSLLFSPNVNYSIPFGDLKEVSDGNQKRRFYGGASFIYTF